MGPNKTNQEKRYLAYELLGAGESLIDIAELLDVKPFTVSRWRDSAEGQARISAIRAERAAQVRDKSNEALRILLDNSIIAANTMIDMMITAVDERVRLAAAQQVLDRIGLPVIDPVQQPEEDVCDYSKLDDKERDDLERLHKKARGELVG